MKILKSLLSRRSRWLRKPVNSGSYHAWLIDRGSLTRRLKASTHDFRVQPMRVSNGNVLADEANALRLKPKRLALIREVQLLCAGKPAVFAHSILPRSSLRGAWHSLGSLQEQPLGAILFANPKVARTALEFKKLPSYHPLYRRATASMEELPTMLWARRSVFRLQHAAILVTEVFLPDVLKLQQSAIDGEKTDMNNKR